MANILMVNFPAEGHVNPTLGIVEAFKKRGDNVHYVTTERFRTRLEGVGASVHTHPDLVTGVSIKPFTPEGLNAFLNIQVKTCLHVLEIVSTLKQNIQFDFVFYDKFGAGELVRDYLNIPGVVSSASFLMPENRLEAIPLHPNNAANFLPSEEVQSSIDKFESEYGVKLKSLLQLMNNQGELTVVYTSEFFQPTRELFDSTCHFIGPSFPNRNVEHSFPLWKLENEKVIYISMGTVLDDIEGFFNKCIEAFTDFDGKVVIAAGERTDFSKLKEAPENFLIFSYVPQLDVLKKADVFITHGGMNSVNEGIHFGVPLVVMPFDKDQPMVAQRLVDLEAGHRIEKETVTSAILRNAVEEVLKDEKYKKGIEAIKRSFEKAPGPVREAERIIGYMEGKLSVSS